LQGPEMVAYNPFDSRTPTDCPHMQVLVGCSVTSLNTS